MTSNQARKQPFVLLVLCCVITASSFAVWVYNVCVTVHDPTGITGWGGSWRWLAADQTTLSPLMILLTFAIPLATWVYPRVYPGRAVPQWLVRGFGRPFYQFVLYAGLFGTLAGMILALSAVGASSTLDKSQQLSQLIAGTATALISSLVALVAAAFAYVLQGVMRRAGMIQVDAARSWQAELDRLLQGAQSLRQALGGVAAVLRELKETALELKGICKSLPSAFADLVQPVRNVPVELSQVNKLLNSVVENQKESLRFQNAQLSAQHEHLGVEREQLSVQREMLKALQVLSRQYCETSLPIQNSTFKCVKELLATVKQEHAAAELERIAHQESALAFSKAVAPSPPINGKNRPSVTV
jgi:hypothetical protein